MKISTKCTDNFMNVGMKDNKYPGLLGVHYFPDGSYYKGTLKNNIPEGKGVICRADGTKYFGSVKNGMRHGKGVMISPAGEKIIGIFYHGDLIKKARSSKGGYIYPKALVYPRLADKTMFSFMQTGVNYNAYLVWKMMPPHLFENRAFDCRNCPFSKYQSRNEYYKGQFNRNNRSGRGTLLLPSKNQISEGYWNGPTFITISGRKITATGDSVHVAKYNKSGRVSHTYYTCDIMREACETCPRASEKC